MKKASLIVAGLAMACIWLGNSQSVSAQAEQPPVEQQTTTAPASYEFVAQPGNSMSVMARRAIQLYDQKTDDITLPEPCIIAAETNIVQSLGPRWLREGEQFKIDESVVSDWARKANGLTEEQRAAWKVYSDNANFTLNDVKLVSEVAAAEQNASGSSSTQQDGNPDQAQGDSNEDQTESSDTQSGTTNGGAPWYWWVVGAGTIGALYYLLGGRSGSQGNKSSK